MPNVPYSPRDPRTTPTIGRTGGHVDLELTENTAFVVKWYLTDEAGSPIQMEGIYKAAMVIYSDADNDNPPNPTADSTDILAIDSDTDVGLLYFDKSAVVVDLDASVINGLDSTKFPNAGFQLDIWLADDLNQRQRLLEGHVSLIPSAMSA